MDLTDLSLEELANLEITSVAKKPQRLKNVASAVFVLSQEDLLHSGATSIPEALRMVPGVQVARIDANKWAVSVRGGNTRFANKLLVLIDGRAVYSPIFSGVYWEVQDTVLADVERIEVIRGPGATVWGANAVNGVINIITKHSADTQGSLLEVAAGTEDPGLHVVARHGGSLGQQGAYRVYAKGDKVQSGHQPDGDSTHDRWHKLRTGFRTDWQGVKDNLFMLQGEFYQGQAQGLTSLPSSLTFTFFDGVESIDFKGGNLLARWQDDASSVQFYYNYASRFERGTDQKIHTFNLDLQHRFDLGRYHELTVGAGYRLTADDLDGSEYIAVQQEHEVYDVLSGFIQDEIRLFENRALLTLGTKFEYNDFSGFEVQPSARALYKATEDQRLWASVSRAVRTPSRAERDVSLNTTTLSPPYPPSLGLPPFNALVVAEGNDDYESEELIAWEMGYRYLPSSTFSLDIATFYHQYDNLRTIEFNPADASLVFPLGLRVPLTLDNKMEAESYGAELALDWRPVQQLYFEAAYTLLKVDYDLDSDSTDFGQFGLIDGSDPQHQFSLRSSYKVRDDLDLDLWVRYVGQLKGHLIDIDEYVTADLRLAWRPQPGLELSLMGKNLIGGGHLEFDPEVGNPKYEVSPSVYGMVRWSF